MKLNLVILVLFSLQNCYSQITSSEKTTDVTDVTKNEITNVDSAIVDYFVVFNIVDRSSDPELESFTKKYKVGVKFQNCAIDSFAYKNAKKNNWKLANTLTSEFGAGWKNEFSYTLPGVDMKK